MIKFLLAWLISTPLYAGGFDQNPTIEGGTDGTTIGNTSDSLKVISIQAGAGSSSTPWFVNIRNASGTELGLSAAPFIIAPVDGQKSTYSIAFTGLVTAASATDIACLTGSGSKTIRITHVEISGTTSAGSGNSVNATLVKRSAADSGGVSSALTFVPHDSTDGAATATAVSYTANPSLGAAVGNIRAFRIDLSSSGVAGTPAIWDFGDRGGVRDIVLHGTSQQVCINFGTVTITGPVIDGSFEITEE